MAGALQLGCTTGYRAFIVSKDGIPLGDLPISNVEWHRILDEFSEAIIEVPLSGKDCAPCDLIGQIGVWHHELVLLRDGEYVWSGPIVTISVTRALAVITARDLFALMDKRILHETHCYGLACGGAPADLTVIATALINDAFIVDGHGYQIEVFNLTVNSLEGGLGERLYLPGEHAWESLQEELQLGLDATVLGKKIILGAVPFGRTSTLTSDDFLVDLEYEVNGLETATRTIAKGAAGIIGLATAPNTDANGEHPYYGLLEFEGNDRQEATTQVFADQVAQDVQDIHFPPAATLITPTGARLSPNAPVAISELVPGVLIPVIATDLCVNASGEYILIELIVSWSQEEGEAVQISLGTKASVNTGEGNN